MAVVLALASLGARADVALVGVFPGKAAILAVDGAEPRAVRVGQKLGDVRVVSVEKDRAVVEAGGKRRTLLLGQHSSPRHASETAVLQADARGHFFAQGSVNGAPMRFVVDTGATYIVLPAAEARRLAIDYRKGQAGPTQTANGTARAWRIRLDSVKVGDIELAHIDAAVVESQLDVSLLGMSFLNRVDMRREGQTMILTRRF